MKTTEDKEEFIELRAKNYSFDKIADKLDIAKTTLISWQKELQNDIKNLRAIEKEKLYKQYAMTKEAKIKAFGELLGRIKEELANRDLKEVSTKELIDLAVKINKLLDDEIEDLKFILADDEVTEINFLQEVEL